MELYTYTKLSAVNRERFDLIRNCHLIQVGFIPFDARSSNPLQSSPFMFRRESRRYFAKQSLQPGGFAPPPVQPSGALGQGATL